MLIGCTTPKRPLTKISDLSPMPPGGSKHTQGSEGPANVGQALWGEVLGVFGHLSRDKCLTKQGSKRRKLALTLTS